MEKNMESTDCHDEVITSDFTVAELWQRLPLLLVEETFGYLALQNGGRLCRVSEDWKARLSRQALFNKGTIFFQWTKKRPEGYWWSDEEIARLLWGEELHLKIDTMDHFVLIDKLKREEPPIKYGMLCDKLIEIHQSLKIFTFYKHRITVSKLGLESVSEVLLKKPMVYRFVDCVLEFSLGSFNFFSENNGWDCKAENLDSFRWVFSMARTNWTVDTKTFQSVEAVTGPKDDSGESADRILEAFVDGLVPGSPNKIISLLWPYSVQQLQWLKTCLESPETTVNADVASLIASSYEMYIKSREANFGSTTEKSKTLMGLCWKDKDLDVVDCAFLARLLDMTPGVPKPPYLLPNDITMVKRA